MKGQTLIETVLAGSLIAIIVSGVSVLIVSALNNAGFAKNQSLATQYAQDGLEVLRSIRNADYATFAAYDNSNTVYCLSKGATTLGAAASACTTTNIDNFFIRSVVIRKNSCDIGVSKATITVGWTDGKCTTGTYCHMSQLVSCLSAVNPVSGP